MKPHQSTETGRSMWWRSESGFTLVELMAGLVIALVIVAAGFTAMTSSNKAAQANDQAADTQQNVRLAMELLSRDIKLAGFGMTAPVGACATAIVPADNTPAGVDTGADSVSLVVPTTSNVAPLWTLAIQATEATGSTLTLQAGAVAAMQTAGLAVNSVVSVGGAVSGTVTVIAGDVLTLANPVGAAAVFPVGTPVYLLQCVNYATSTNPAICGNNGPCLVRGGVAIADGIEDIQLAYACDGCNAAVNGGVAEGIADDQNGSNSFDQADFITNNTWAAAPMTPSNIRLVQINVVARQTRTDQGFGDTRTPASSSAAALQVSDHNHADDPGFNLLTYQQIRRRLLTRTVQTRNLGL